MVRNKTFRELQQRYETCKAALLSASRSAVKLRRDLSAERDARQFAEQRAAELEARVKSLTRTIADVEEILHDA